MSSSRKDSGNLWISVADIFSLLSLSLIVIVMQLPDLLNETETLPLPVVSADALSGQTVDEDRTPTVRWDDDAPRNPDRGSTCPARLRASPEFRAAAGARSRIQLPCWPQGFGGTGPLADIDVVIQQAHEFHGQSVVIVECAPTDLPGCARLQWVLAERGVAVAARVELEPR